MKKQKGHHSNTETLAVKGCIPRPCRETQPKSMFSLKFVRQKGSGLLLLLDLFYQLSWRSGFRRDICNHYKPAVVQDFGAHQYKLSSPEKTMPLSELH